MYFFCSPENRTPPENINMSDTVDRDIDIIENNRPKPRSCVKFPCGICNKSVKKITIKLASVIPVIYGYTLYAMISQMHNMNASKLWMILSTVWDIFLNTI